MNASGNTISLAPVAAASPMRRTALSMHASVSKGTLPAWTTATFKDDCCSVMAAPWACTWRGLCDHLDPVLGHRMHQPVHGIVSAVSYTHLRAHETDSYLVCRLLLEKK